MISDFSAGGICLCYCDVERDCPHTDGDEPAGDWVTSHESVYDVLVNKKSKAMLVFILFSTEENFVSFLCCSFAKILQSYFRVQRCSTSICPFRVLVSGVCLQLLVSLCSMCLFEVPVDNKNTFSYPILRLCDAPDKSNILRIL